MSSARRFGVAFSATLLAMATLLAAGGCTGRAHRQDADQAVHPRWHQITLPLPPGEPGRLILRDVTACAGRWYVVGAVGGPGEVTRPAAWTSTDAQTWSALPLRPGSYYGRRHVLYTAACRDGRLATIGAKIGGAHGYPRTSAWHQLSDGSLVETIDPYTLYGGPAAVNVARMVAGPPGWLITGNRMSGAAVWVSTDSAAFDIVEAAPELASDARGESWAFDAVAMPEGWLVVGGILRPGRIDRDPLAWTSVDGRTWRRVAVPGTDGYDELQRVALVGDTPVAVGLRDQGFGVWRGGEHGWEPAGRFAMSGSGGPRAVRTVTVVGDQIVAVVSDGATHGLWASPDEGRSWRPVSAPAVLPSGRSDRAAATATDGDRLLLVADDGQAGRVWWTGSVPAR